MGRKSKKRTKAEEVSPQKGPGSGNADGSSPPNGPTSFSLFTTPVDEEIDLHGMAVDEAMVQVELALARYIRKPQASLRIIHGKSSENKDSIRGTLRRNLETVWRKKIRSFRPEPGNPGATLVYLSQS